MRGGANGPLSELLHESRARASDAWPLEAMQAARERRKAVRDKWLQKHGGYSNMDSIMQTEIENAKMDDTQKAHVKKTYENSTAEPDVNNEQRERGIAFYITKNKHDIRLKYFFVINEKGEEIIAEIKDELQKLESTLFTLNNVAEYNFPTKGEYVIQIKKDSSVDRLTNIIIYLKSDKESKIVLKWSDDSRAKHLPLEDQFNNKIEEITDV